MAHGSWLFVYLLLFGEALVLALVMMPSGIRLARRKGFTADPGGRHIHDRTMPTLGGAVIVGSFIGVIIGNAILGMLFSSLLKSLLPDAVGVYLPNIASKVLPLAAILTGAMLMFVMGLVDDRKGLGPKFKLFVQILAALLLVIADVRVHGFLPVWMGIIVTVVWIVFITNAFNFLDNMDGLCGGIAFITSVAFGLNAFFAGEWYVAAVFVTLSGALLGFLRYNFFPARIFMGDNGSLFIGFIIASLSIVATYYESDVPTAWPILTPVIILGVPIFDSISVLWIRLREGRPLMQGDKSHFSHRLTDLGMSRRRAVTFIYIVTAAVALAAIPLRTVNNFGALAILVQTALVFLIIYRIERRARHFKDGEASPE